MSRLITLSRYFGRQYLLNFMGFLLSLSGIIYLFEIAELLRRSAEKPDATFDVILRMALYKLPETVEHVLPFVTLFAGMFTFWRLTRSQELIVTRAAGISVWQFMMPAVTMTVLFACINVMLFNPVGAALSSRYRDMESRYLQNTPRLELTGAGIWLRQSDKQYHYLLHADRVETKPLTLIPLIIFIYEHNNKYAGRIDAPEATLGNKAWVIKNAWFNWDGQKPEQVTEYRLPTTLTLDKIQESMALPNTISFWQLPAFIDSIKTIGLPATRHELAFHRLLSQPVMLCAMAIFAAALSLRMTRRGGTLSIMGGGAVIALGVYFLNNIVFTLGTNQTFPPPLAAWSIPLAALASASAILFFLEEG